MGHPEWWCAGYVSGSSVTSNFMEWAAPGLRVTVLSPTLAVSMQVMCSQESGCISGILAQNSSQGFQTTVELEPDLATVILRLPAGSWSTQVAVVLRYGRSVRP